MTTGLGHSVAGAFQLGAKPWEWVWLRGSGKALKLGLGHPQTCSTDSLLHLRRRGPFQGDTLDSSLLPVAWARSL